MEKIAFEIVVTEMLPVKSTYYVVAENMAEALSKIDEIPVHLQLKGSSSAKATELDIDRKPQDRKVVEISFDHNGNNRGATYSSNFRRMVMSDLRNILNCRVDDYSVSYGVMGIAAGSHRIVVYSEMSEDNTTLDVVIGYRTLSKSSRFLTRDNRFRQLSPEELSEVDHGRGYALDLRSLKKVAPELIYSFEIFSAADYKQASETVARMVKDAKACAGSLDRGDRGKSRICNSCPYQLGCISTNM